MKSRDDVSLIIYVDVEAENLKKLAQDKAELTAHFFETYWLIPESNQSEWSNKNGNALFYEAGQSKVRALNQTVKKCSAKWIFYLEWDEAFDTGQFAQLSPALSSVFAVKINQAQSNSAVKVNHQVRLFPNPRIDQHDVFQGTAFPDIYPFSSDKSWDFGFSSLEIQKTKAIYDNRQCRLESEFEAENTLSLFINAVWNAENKNFKEAEDLFKAAIESRELFLVDLLAAYNGMADVLCEQDRWFDAARYVQKSIDLCPDQCLPYLLMYKINSYQHNWEKAYEYLCLYGEYSAHTSKANLDVRLPEDEFTLLMGETFFNLKKIEEAFEHYARFFKQRDGDINPTILERLLIYAIEQKDFDHAALYLSRLFDPYLPDKLNHVMEIKLHEVLSLFMDNGWHKFVIDLYERLYKSHQTESMLLRRVAAILKMGQVDKARQLMAQEGLQFDMWAG